MQGAAATRVTDTRQAAASLVLGPLADSPCGWQPGH
jgi:hypothetical protein